MVNVFGQSSKRGPPGPPGVQGPPGKDGLTVTKWFPDQAVEWWRNASDAAFYFDDETTGFTHKDDKITGLKSHSKTWHNDAISEGDIGKLTKIQKGYSLEFMNSLFFIEKMSLARVTPLTACLTLSFRVSKAPSEREYLISTYNRAVSIQGEKIQVWGCVNEPVEIPLDTEDWNIVFIQWKDGGDYAGYVYNFVQPVKNFITSEGHKQLGLYIGGLKNGHNFNGSICAIDITNHYTPDNIPIEMRDLLMWDHTYRIEKFTEQWMEAET